MLYRRKGNFDVIMEATQNPVHHVKHQESIFVLATAVVAMQVYRLFTQAMECKKMMQHRDDCVPTLASVGAFINQVINLQ